MSDTPQALPPAERTVGQLVAETIRLYGRRFLLCLPLGLPAAVLDVVAAQAPRTTGFWVALTAGPALLTLSYVGATLVALDASRAPRRLALAYAAGVLVFVPFPLLATLFILPGLAWLALFGLVVPAILVEGRGFRDGLNRATRLARADYVHALGSLAALALVYFVSRFGLAVLLRGQGEQTEAVAAFLADVVIAPLLFLGTALLYVDQAARVVDSGRPTTKRPRRASRADLHPADHAHGAGRPDAQVEP
ncbi:MAG TPA: hypothetical protein VK874_14690 [Gaiellaceae bacterium]|nr:hypothetical protein [Gaiellaceae bacterium]